MPEITLGQVRAEEAISNIRQKLRVPTERWDDFMGAAQAKAFTVAGATKLDLVADFQQLMVDALEKGTTITDFRKGFDQSVQRHGWSYKGKRGWRTSLIYNTNLRTAHMAGRWQQLQQTKTQRPFMMYLTVGDSRVRDQHKVWHRLVLPVDDKFWDSHYPPNGWGCRCYSRTLSQHQLDREGLSVDQGPTIQRSERIDSRTGQYYGEVPEGIDTGWDYNVGKAWLGPDIALGEKIAALPDGLRSQVLGQIQEQSAIQTSWQSWLESRRSEGRPRGYAHTVGHLPDSLFIALARRDTPPANTAIVVFDNQIDHLQGEHKPESKRILPEWLEQLPTQLQNYQALLRNRQTGNVLFVLDATEEGRNGRAVVAIDFKRKGEQFNSVRSLGVVNLNDLNKKDYEILEGEL